MKKSVFLIFTALLLTAAPTFAASTIGGVFFYCSGDLDPERHFQGMTGNDVLESEAKKTANEFCEGATGGHAIKVVYVYKNGTQKTDDGGF